MMFSVMAITVFIDLITAVAVGVVMASLLFMKRMTDIQLDGIEAINSSAHEGSPLTDTERAIMDASNCRILLYRLSGPMSFSSAKGMARRLASFDDYDALILDLTDVPVVDFTTSRALEDIIHDAQDSRRQAYLVGARPQVNTMLTKQGVMQQLAEGHVCKLRLEAFEKAGKTLGIDIEKISARTT